MLVCIKTGFLNKKKKTSNNESESAKFNKIKGEKKINNLKK